MNPFEIRARGNAEADVFVYGDIGASWFEESITAAKFVRDLQNVDAKTINVRINSFGGAVSDALAIYNALQRHPAQVNTFVDGVALSAASLIAMAGKTVTMAENGVLMIHGPRAMASGTAQEMREAADVLDKFAQAMAPSYASKTGKSSSEMLALLTDGADHWYTATEAQAAGFADEVSAAIPVEASFDLRRYRSAPAAAAAFSRSITMPGTTQTAAATPAAQPHEPNI
jgi:ATP-dependent protease ClpP protease subunit